MRNDRERDTLILETDLTDEEKEIIRQGREEYKKGGYVSLSEAKRMLGHE